LECSTLAVKKGLLGGPAAKRFTEECEAQAQRAACEARQKLVDQGIDPDGPEVAKKRLEQWKQLQTLDQNEAKRALKAGRTEVANNLKAPSTAKLVSEKVMMVCPDGNIVTSHTV